MKLPYVSLVILLSSIEDTISLNTTAIKNFIPTWRLYIQKSNETEAPSEYPSSEPSSIPSVSPSSRPSLRPSANPSSEPTAMPTSSPTKLRKTECKVRMYYQKKYCWHDDAQNSKCNYDYKFCVTRKGEDLEMQDCGKSGKQKWLVLGRTVRPSDDRKMCWTRKGERGIRLERCGGKYWKDQQFDGVCYDKKQIHPQGEEKWCLTSGHEPRKNEKCKFQECKKADNSHTDRWVKG